MNERQKHAARVLWKGLTEKTLIAKKGLMSDRDRIVLPMVMAKEIKQLLSELLEENNKELAKRVRLEYLNECGWIKPEQQDWEYMAWLENQD